MRAVLDDYVKRISRACAIEVSEVRDSEAAEKKLDADRAAISVLLDAGGKTWSSEAFAKWLGELRDRGTREIIFVCGDADGFSGKLRERVKQRFALSAMTYSHELARVMLVGSPSFYRNIEPGMRTTSMRGSVFSTTTGC